MKPLVSILIPAHNAEKWVAETLDSALAQTWEPKEIVLVDDGSTDRTLAIARTFESKGVRVFTQPNSGASSARNRAWQESRGEWLQFLDADDLLHPEKIREQMSLAGQLGTYFAYCGRWGRFVSSVKEVDLREQPLCRDGDPVQWITIKLRDDAMMHPAAWMLSRALCERAGKWDASLTLDDDGEFFSRVVFASDGVRNCDAAVSYYRSGVPGSLSGRKSGAAWKSAFRSLELTSGLLLSRAPEPSSRLAAANAFQTMAYSAYPDEPELSRKCEAMAKSLGGSRVRPGGGAIFTAISRTLGWRFARRIQRMRS